MQGRKQPPQGEELARQQRSEAGRKGGRASASRQNRDRFGQFAGRADVPQGKPDSKPRSGSDGQETRADNDTPR